MSARVVRRLVQVAPSRRRSRDRASLASAVSSGRCGRRRDAAQVEAQLPRALLDVGGGQHELPQNTARHDDHEGWHEGHESYPRALRVLASCASCHELPQHVRQDPAVRERRQLLRRVDAHRRREHLDRTVLGGRPHHDRRRAAAAPRPTREVEHLAAGQAERSRPTRRRLNSSGSTPMLTRLLR